MAADDSRDREQTPPGEEAGADSRSESGPAPEPEPEDPPQEWPSGNTVLDNRGQVVSAGRITGGVHYHENIGETTTRRLRQATRISHSRVEDVLTTFCPSDAGRYETFLAELKSHGTGVITGEPGCGRRITAVHALATLREGTPIEEVVVDPDSRDAGLIGLSTGSGHSRFLDLTPLGRPTPIQYARLRTLVEEVRGSGEFFVIIARPGQRDDYVAEHRAWLRIDGPAQAVDVFHRAMENRCGIRAADLWSHHPDVCEALEGAEPERATRLAQEAERARPPSPVSEEEHTAWIGSVLKEFADATEELTTWFADHDLEKEFQRVLLEAVALLEGGARATIVQQAHRLAGLWRIPSMWRTPISGEGLTAHLREIGAHVREDRVRFNRPGFGDEVLDYLWKEHPRARDSLQEWASEAVSKLGWRERAASGQRWLRLAQRHGDPAPVSSMIDHWGSSSELMWEAVPVIAEAAVTPGLGPKVLSHLYRVAVSPGVSLRDRTVVEVCRVYGRVQPGTALTRLRHIAEKASATWERTLVQALEDIAGEPGNTTVVLEELTRWTAKAERGRRAFVAALALGRILADHRGGTVPRVLEELERREVASDVVSTAWAASASGGTEVGRALWAWLDALSHRRGDPGAASEVLLRAARVHVRFSPVLENSLRRWRHAHVRRAWTVDELYRALVEHEEEQ
ncbi:hypothetical protein [Nocardiopsis halotolerans]|uniref:hypothetical protein n=1 Tax=Nocardiopsis halotolerans TaxID=124252 RepID=UPI0003450E00|nr:hypothetical protein [Nocardiopsis halotolerans]